MKSSRACAKRPTPLERVRVIDTHAHLSDDDAAEVLARARAAGVTQVIDIATTIAGAREVVARAARDDRVYA
jgi:Tat protein secretion system quality control protein TatD with DNase activity